MKTLLNIALLMTSLCMSGVVLTEEVTQEAKAPNSNSIIVIESSRIIAETVEGKSIRDRIESIDKRYSEQLEKLRKELEEDAASYETKKRTATKDALKDFEEQFVEKQEKYNRLAQRAQRELNEKGGEEINVFDKKVREVVAQWAKSNGYDVVLLKESGVYYASERVDKTNEIIKILNDSYKPAKAVAAPAQAPAKKN